MKVLHVIPSVSERSGGPGQAIVEMCRALCEQGIEVLVATTNAGVKSFESESLQLSGQQSLSPQSSVLITHHLYKGVPTIFFPVQWGQSFKYSRPLATWLDQNVKAFDVIHIHAVFNHACIAAARACRKHRVPYVIRPLGTLDPWSMKQGRLRKKLFWYTVGKRMLRSAAAVHYTAPAEQQAVEQSLGLNHGTVIPLGIDRDMFDRADAEQSFLRQFPSLVDHPYILVLSRLHPKKGLDVLVKAFLNLVAEEQFARWRLVLAGEGPANYVASLTRLVNDNHATEFVLFPGWLEGNQKLSALRGASLLALTSYQENFGLCVVEAMACGVSVLVSPHVNLAPEIEAAGAGWVVPVDKDTLRTALAKVLASESERLRRGQAGQMLAYHYTWPGISARLGKLYESVVTHA